MTDPRPSHPFAWMQGAPAPALVCQPLVKLAPHFFTTRSWRIGSSPPDAASAWDDVARAIDVPPERLVRLRQVHGRTVSTVRRGAEAPALAEADIATTDDPDRAIAVQSADCAPLLLADRGTGAVAAVHAGWRGLQAAVPRAAVQAMRESWGTRPADLVAAIGPSIGACCYEVGEDVHAAFAAADFDGASGLAWFTPGRRPDHWNFDGWAAARDQLVAAGLPPQQIHLSRLCTGCFPGWFCSYRKEGAGTGRMAAVIRPRPSRTVG
jgi:purine-nucleoside/S-methyl-5'-thioadenosine phosphorylase / adenosine deaminase